MAEYTFDVAGREQDLRLLQEDLWGEEVLRFWEDDGPEDSGTHGLRRFSSVMTTGAEDEPNALSTAETLLELVNGALSIYLPAIRFVSDGSEYAPNRIFGKADKHPSEIPTYVLRRELPLRIAGAYRNGTALGFHGRPRALSRVELIERLSAIGRPTMRVAKSKLLGLIDLGLSDEKDDALLRYSGGPLDWVAIYKIRDTLNSAGATTLPESQSRRIGNTANNFSISGFDSRHGVQDNQGSAQLAIDVETGARWALEATQAFMQPRVRLPA